jgi:hypothetical protein
LNVNGPTSDEDRRALEDLTDRMVVQFPLVPPDYVRNVVNATWAEFNGRPIRAFVPVLVERTARQRLRDFAGA